MFQKVDEARFVEGEHEMLRLWSERDVFRRLLDKNAGGPKWSFLDGPITANNPMGVHHAWGRTYKDVYQRYRAMTGHELRYQNGFDCQGLWVEVEVEKEMGLGTKTAIVEQGIDKFVHECKKRVLTFAARQTEQSVRLGYWMEWDDPEELRKLASHIGDEETLTLQTPKGETASGSAEELTARLGNPQWGGSYFTFSTENNETIWTFLKKCFERGKIYLGHDVMPWGGRAGSAYSQMEIADGRKLTTHRSCFVRFPLIEEQDGTTETRRHGGVPEYLLVWTTTPWTLTSNVAAAVNPDLEYVRVKAQTRGDEEPAYYYFAKENLEFKRLEREFKEGFGRPEWQWPDGLDKLKTISQIFKEQGKYKVDGTVKGEEMIGWRYAGPFDDLDAQNQPTGYPDRTSQLQIYADRWSQPSFTREQLAKDAKKLTTAVSLDDAPQVPNSLVEDKALTAIDEQQDWIDKKLRTEWRDKLEEGPKLISGLLEAAKSVGILTSRLVDYDTNFSELDRALRNLGMETAFARDWRALVAANESTLTVGTTLKHIYSVQPKSEEGRQALQEWVGEAQPNLTPELINSLSLAIERVFHSLETELGSILFKSGAEAHHVIDGGRDFKGNPHVVAGEGTGIVHIAPGCGDVDNQIGQSIRLPVIAPLSEDGSYGPGFDDRFTGHTAVDPATADLVFEQLKEKGHFVYVEEYPHVYPHCWRTGEELVFRLVDEWFINMDWREEIKDVTRAIEWLPESIQGQDREVEWLSTMRDWMISKKRFWGLALPIWVNPNDASDFEVIGSLAELKERAVEGWDEFEGHTPHRPWIDVVKIKSEKTGAVLTRVEDVGNPWLDAGITPFSTMGYREQPDMWEQWYPADFVTECFPGQFRNWFYSLLALSTMMRHGETDKPEEKRPFKTLLGHRLVMDETGQPMHKSDGTAIWFEEAAEQLGVDTLRWMYLAHNPASDLRFGTRHPDEPVTLNTPEGPISETKEGLPTVKVTSKPADDIRRQVLIPLWNSYAFFVNYAVADEFAPTLEQVPLADRPEIDRWILSRLQELIGTAHESFEAYDVATFVAAATTYIDDLSNWYIRRNRRRFWRSKDASDTDKTAAYQTLHEVLLTLTKLLAPCVPFITERMYGNLIGDTSPRATSRGSNAGESSVPRGVARGLGGEHSDSVHLCEYPSIDESKLDLELNRKTADVQTLVRLGHRLRESAELRVRQPLAELQFAASDAAQASALEQSADIIADELNVKMVTRSENLDDLVSYSFKPNLKTLGPKYGKLLGVIRKELPEMDGALLAPLRNGKPVTITLGGEEVTLEPDDVLVSTEQASDWASGDDGGIQVALSTTLTPALIREGMARDFVRHVQQARKDAGLVITDRIRIFYFTSDADVQIAITEHEESIQASTGWKDKGVLRPTDIDEWSEYIRTETLSDSITHTTAKDVPVEPVTIGESQVAIWIKPA